MPKKPLEPTHGKESRRSFLAKLGLGAAALAAISLPLLRLRQRNPDHKPQSSDPSPGRTQYFIPARDPRKSR